MELSEVKLRHGGPSVGNDPLIDAHCLKCGYPLRGLPENHCPECGTAFDPADFARTYHPLWPLLLAWYLTAQVAQPLWEVIDRSFRHPSWHQPGWLLEYLGLVPGLRARVGATLMLLFGIAAIVGLQRRRDWGRKAVIAMLICPILVALCGDIYRQIIYHGQFRIHLPSRLVWVLESVVPAVLILILLCDRLRRRTLSCRGQWPTAPFLLRRFERRSDWPPLMFILLATLAINHLSFLALWAREVPYPSQFPVRIAQWAAIALEEVIIVGGYLLTFRKVWRQCASPRKALAALAWLLVAVYSLRLVHELVVFPWVSGNALTNWFPGRLLLSLRVATGVFVGSILPVVCLWLFARTLRPEDTWVLNRPPSEAVAKG